MTTSSPDAEPVPSDDAGTSAAKSSRVPNASRLRAGFVEAMGLVRHDWQWLALGVVYLLAWYTPFTDHGTSGDGPLRWSWDQVYSISFTLGFTLYVPLCAGIIIWSQRAALRDYWGRITAHYPPGHPKRQGNLIPLALGCFLLFVSHLIEVKGIGIAALILIVWGAVYRVYGPLMWRALLVPMLLLLVMIPLPDHIVQDYATYKVTAICVKLAAGLLSILHVPAYGVLSMLHLRGYAVDVPPIQCAGTNILLMVILILFTYHMCRKTDPTLIVLSFIVGGVLSVVLQILRVATVGILYGTQPDVAQWLMYSSLVSAFFIAFTTFVTLQIMRISFLDRVKVPESVLRAAKVTGQGMTVVTTPLDRSVDFFGKIIKLWSRSERAIEKGFKALTPKRKGQRRRW